MLDVMTWPTPHRCYQPFFCEENIWQLCARHDFGAADAYVVFISNADRTCALWSQRAARAVGAPVVWDYHVILVDDSGPNAQVWDLDSLVGAPAAFEHWWQVTFPFKEDLPAQFQPEFRVIDAGEFIDRFSSDRSHMRNDDGHWQAPPPAWEPIWRAEKGMNLDRFVDMSCEFVGDVMDAGEIVRRFSSHRRM
jgi:hypothetical protein